MAFDTIDTERLQDKLQYYGIKGKELTLLDSFMTERRQNISIDTLYSDKLLSPRETVIQGSKLSALL